jgi:hypothetical protein
MFSIVPYNKGVRVILQNRVFPEPYPLTGRITMLLIDTHHRRLHDGTQEVPVLSR